jgi:hypothetical protein
MQVLTAVIYLDARILNCGMRGESDGRGDRLV